MNIRPYFWLFLSYCIGMLFITDCAFARQNIKRYPDDPDNPNSQNDCVFFEDHDGKDINNNNFPDGCEYCYLELPSKTVKLTLEEYNKLGKNKLPPLPHGKTCLSYKNSQNFDLTEIQRCQIHLPPEVYKIDMDHDSIPDSCDYFIEWIKDFNSTLPEILSADKMYIINKFTIELSIDLPIEKEIEISHYLERKYNLTATYCIQNPSDVAPDGCFGYLFTDYCEFESQHIKNEEEGKALIKNLEKEEGVLSAHFNFSSHAHGDEEE